MTQPAAPDCPKCGAPQAQGHVLCPFCKSAYSEEALRFAIPCPSCKTLSAWGQMKCVQCAGWIVVKCVFCSNVSPHTVPACLACNEPFQGAMERKAARDAEIQRQRTMQAVSTYGSVGASFLGAVAGAVLTDGVTHHHHHHHASSYDSSSYDSSSADSSSVTAQATTGASFLSSFFDASATDASTTSSSDDSSVAGSALSGLADAASSWFDSSDGS